MVRVLLEQTLVDDRKLDTCWSKSTLIDLGFFSTWRDCSSLS
jgi:hypothetical protein